MTDSQVQASLSLCIEELVRSRFERTKPDAVVRMLSYRVRFKKDHPGFTSFDQEIRVRKCMQNREPS